MGSVVLVAYNVEEEIKSQILGIVTSIEDDIDVVFVNDGSTDRTGEIADDFLDKISSEYVNQITYVSTNHVGNERAKRIGAIHAQTKDILFVDIRKE